jgi:radical SAM superfamily enzyme YgiQ (UPF0313 family)
MDVPRLLRMCEVEELSDRRSIREPLVVFGGQACAAPAPIAGFADIVALGDGEITGPIIGGLLEAKATRDDVMRELDGVDGFWVPSRTLRLVRVEGKTFAARLVQTSGPTIEASRGCRRACRFCAIGWAGGTYRESQISSLPAGRCNVFSADFGGLSTATAIKEIARTCRTVLTGVDTAHDGIPESGAISVGIEGYSARLRKACGKPIGSDRLSEIMRRSGGGAKKLYMIHGLPGETEGDRDEFWRALDEIRAPAIISSTHFTPVAHTPLGGESGGHNDAAREFVLRLRERFRTSGGVGVLVYEPKGRELSEHDVYLQRAPVDAWSYLLTATWGSVSSGRWRDRAVGLGLAPLQAGREPWAFVDVGVSRKRLSSAKRAYWSALSPDALSW